MGKIAKAKHKLYTKRKRQVLAHSSRVKDKEKRATRARKAKLKAITETCTRLLAERRKERKNAN